MNRRRLVPRVVAIAAVAIFANACAQGSTNAPPSASSPSASPNPVGATFLAAPSAASRAEDAPSFEDIPPGTELAPGTYALNYASIGGADGYPTLAFVFTVPAGWSRVELDGVVWNDAGVRLKFLVADNLYVDPCDPGRGLRDPAVGPSVADLTAALATVPGWTVSSSMTGMFHGFPGDRIELVGPADLSSCTAGGASGSLLLHSLGNPGYSLAATEGERHDLRVIDVNGERVVVEAISTGDASADALAELQSVVDDVGIQP